MSKSPRNRTLTVTQSECDYYLNFCKTLKKSVSVDDIKNSIIYGDIYDVVDLLPSSFVSLLILDPPYNLNKVFSSTKFKVLSDREYYSYVDSWLSKLIRLLLPNASIYVCGDWRNSLVLQEVLQKYFIIRNRITWEREKGRGALKNWKNCSEDIWFCTVSNTYTFNVNSVKLKRRVFAPYRENGLPKDWNQVGEERFRVTYPSNLWTDITVPFWSMAENTVHPTQKPEKLIAKLILASSNEGDIVLDPFLGSGTTAVVAKKLNRCYVGVEREKIYAALAQKRLLAVNSNKIQGYIDGVFLDRNMR